MAHRLISYPLLRTIHLYAGFVSVVFLLMYFITGYLLVRESWFSHDQVEAQTQILELPASFSELDKEAIPYAMMRELGLEGHAEGYRERDGKLNMSYVTLRANYRVQISEDRSQASVETRPHNLALHNKLFHRMHRYGQGLGYNLYVFMMDMASLALLVFVLTGVFMWLDLVKYRKLGLVCLVLGFAYTAWVMLTFVWA